MIVWVLLLITIALVVHHLVSPYNRLRKTIDLIPGPKSLFLLGNILSFQISKDELWIRIRKYADMYYPIYRLWAGPIPVIFVRHPDDVEIILGNTQMTSRSRLYTFLEPWFGTGILTCSGTKWHKRRKMVAPAFKFNVLQQFVEIFIEEGDLLAKSLKKEGNPVINDLLHLISHHTLNTLCETALGSSLRSEGEFGQTYIEVVEELSFLPVYRFLRPWLYPNFLFDLAPAGRRQNKLLEVLRRFTNTIISKRQAYHHQTDGRYLMNHDKEDASGVVENDNDVGIRKKRMALLDLLLAEQSKNQIDDEGVREEVNSFMFAGHDTLALCICYTIMLLAEHKEIQERARAEVNAVLDETDGKMNLSTLQSLPYLERCIKESLRLYPSVHAISRHMDLSVRLSDYEIPKDTMVHISIIDIHKDSNFWPEPEVFDPDRFLPEKIQGRHSYSYIPFSAGARNCIGQRFAMLEMKAFIGNLLRNFYLEPIDYLKDLRLTADITTQPAHPIRTKFVPINVDTKDTEGT